jgi:hypothetical protein
MTALVVIATADLFAAVVITGTVGVVSLAIRREDRNRTLTSEAIDTVTRAGRWLNGVYVRAPRGVTSAQPGIAPG